MRGNRPGLLILLIQIYSIRHNEELEDKKIFCYHLLTLISFQNYRTFFLLFNNKEKKMLISCWLLISMHG